MVYYIKRSGTKGMRWYHRFHQSYEEKPTRSGKVGEEHFIENKKYKSGKEVAKEVEILLDASKKKWNDKLNKRTNGEIDYVKLQNYYKKHGKEHPSINKLTASELETYMIDFDGDREDNGKLYKEKSHKEQVILTNSLAAEYDQKNRDLKYELWKKQQKIDKTKNPFTKKRLQKEYNEYEEKERNKLNKIYGGVIKDRENGKLKEYGSEETKDLRDKYNELNKREVELLKEEYQVDNGWIEQTTPDLYKEVRNATKEREAFEKENPDYIKTNEAQRINNMYGDGFKDYARDRDDLNYLEYMAMGDYDDDSFGDYSDNYINYKASKEISKNNKSKETALYDKLDSLNAEMAEIDMFSAKDQADIKKEYEEAAEEYKNITGEYPKEYFSTNIETEGPTWGDPSFNGINKIDKDNKKVTISIFSDAYDTSRKMDLDISDNPNKHQKEVLEKLKDMDLSSDLEYDLEEYIANDKHAPQYSTEDFETYKKRNGDDGYFIRDMFDYVKPKSLYIPDKTIKGMDLGILCNYKFDPERNLVIAFNKEGKIAFIAPQDEIKYIKRSGVQGMKWYHRFHQSYEDKPKKNKFNNKINNKDKILYKDPVIVTDEEYNELKNNPAYKKLSEKKQGKVINNIDKIKEKLDKTEDTTKRAELEYKQFKEIQKLPYNKRNEEIKKFLGLDPKDDRYTDLEMKFRAEIRKADKNDKAKLKQDLIWTALMPTNIYAWGELGADTVFAIHAYSKEAKQAKRLRQNTNIDKKTGLRLKNQEFTDDEDMKEINVGFMNFDTNTKSNCMLCTTAYDMRKRGYDVVAKKASMGYFNQDIKNWYPKAKTVDYPIIKDKSTLKNIVKGNKMTVDNVVNELKKQKNARGNLCVAWMGGGGHSIVYEVVNGEVILRDCQTGKKYEGAKINSFLKRTETISATRLDNVAFNPKLIKECIR